MTVLTVALLLLVAITPLGLPGEAQVLLADGTHRPVNEVRVGDQVRSTDPETDVDSTGRVTQTYTYDFTELVEITVSSGATVVATAETGFWVEDREGWVDAHNLVAGDLLRDTSGDRIRITEVRTRSTSHVAHHIAVGDVPAFYVAVGSHHVLVHHV